MATKYLKGFCALWAALIYFSSCVVITRFQFASAVSNITHIRHEAVQRVLESTWWILDRGYHVFVFGVLTWALLNAFDYFKKRPFVVAPIVFLYAISDEIHQSLVNYPAAHTYDVFIDSIGIVIALWLFIRVQIRRDTLAMSGS